MKKIELLSPVGDIETLKYAIHNGADAVYFGGKSFGARKFAKNFTNEEIIEAINYAHLYGVKVYITANTIIYEDEVPSFLEYIKFLYQSGVDAVIMQDIGMISKVRKLYPNLEVHASTQMHNHNDEGLKLLKSMGVTRVVLDRELSLEEINKLSTPIEKEIFIHGALCVSYSGCCLFSSLNGGRSGNRGECVGSCRLPYKLICNDKEIKTNGNYLLSTRELNTTKKLKEILDSNVDSLKIEGRMKSPEYVGYITKIYRMLIDKYYNNEDMTITDKDYTNLQKLFNRKFTTGYLFKDNIININSPNHQGIILGRVIEVNNKKITIKLEEDVNQEDSIRFKESNLGTTLNYLYNKKGLLVNNLKKGDVLVIDNKIGLKTKDTVLKTIDKKLQDEILHYDEKKIPINFKVTALANNPLIVTIDDNINSITLTKDIIEKSKNISTSKEDIKKQLSKLGNTCYKLNSIEIITDDNIFINIKALNELRRELTSLLDKKRIEISKKIILNEDKKDILTLNKSKKIKLHILVRNEKQLKVCLKHHIDTIIVDDESLYQKYQDNKNIYLKLDRVMNKFIEYHDKQPVATELGSVNKYGSNNTLITDYNLNVVNNASVNYLKSNNVKLVTISPEISFERLKLLNPNDIAIILYGKMELMITKYCPLKEILNNCNNCINDQNKYYLEDKDKNRYLLLRKNCLTHIMHYKNIKEDIKKYLNIGITNFRIDLLDETEEELEKILYSYQK